ncbi:MAG: hypothetical protein ACRC33_12180 [Gemmataceae bacterium]
MLHQPHGIRPLLGSIVLFVASAPPCPNAGPVLHPRPYWFGTVPVCFEVISLTDASGRRRVIPFVPPIITIRQNAATPSAVENSPPPGIG